METNHVVKPTEERRIESLVVDAFDLCAKLRRAFMRMAVHSGPANESRLLAFRLERWEEWIQRRGLTFQPTGGPSKQATSTATREICKMCYHPNAIGFQVPDSIWEVIVPTDKQTSVICLACFTRLGDEKLVKWDEDIEFFPVSFVSHLGPMSRQSAPEIPLPR